MHEVRHFVLMSSAASYSLVQRIRRTTTRSRTRTRSAIVSKDTYRNGISNSLRAKSFDRIEATRSGIIRTWGTLRRRWRCLGESFLRRSACSPTNDTLSICKYSVLKLIHEDHSARIVGEDSVEHTQLSGRQSTEKVTHLIRSITISKYMIIAATRHAAIKNDR